MDSHPIHPWEDRKGKVGVDVWGGGGEESNVFQVFASPIPCSAGYWYMIELSHLPHNRSSKWSAFNMWLCYCYKDHVCIFPGGYT